MKKLKLVKLNWFQNGEKKKTILFMENETIEIQQYKEKYENLGYSMCVEIGTAADQAIN